jgi:hypothetical protein
MSFTRTGTTHVMGLFADPTAAGQATRTLANRGFAPGSTTVISAMPYPEEAFALDHRRSRVPFFTVLGALGGISLGALIGIGTVLDYPLVTGGMPIIAWPTLGVILYEFTMLGAMVMTFAGLLALARLPRRTPVHYDARISDGLIGVAVRCPTPERASAAEQILSAAGAQEGTRPGAPARG